VIDVGYFPKLVSARPDWLPAPQTREICSVSNCVSAGPDDWVYHWRHNWLGWFNRIGDAWELIPAEPRGQYRVFAYRMYPEFFR
jgi:hypothetical protein